MANQKKTYFLTPSFDYPPPPTGPIKLGNILTVPSTPDRPLNSGPSFQSPPPSLITTTVKTDWKSTLGKSNSASIGIYAKFLDVIVGAGADASVNWERGDESKYGFERLETSYFNPVEAVAYFQEALKISPVKSFLAKSRIQKSLYVITGLKVVRGGKIKSSKTRAHGGALSLGFDGTAAAVPIEAGPEFEVQKKREVEVEWGQSDDFVFAYRVSRVKVKRKTGEVKEEEYTKGALYDLKYDLEGNVMLEGDADFEVDRFDGDEVVAGEFGEEELSAAQEEDGEECVCVLPEADDV